MKCDVIVPIYNHVEWVKLCVKAIFSNNDYSLINKVYLIDDCSNEDTKKELNLLKNKYDDKIEIITNKKNQGFVKNCNKAFDITKSKYVLLLNSDCILSKNSLYKMMSAMEKNKKIGLLCPISSKAANLSYPLISGYTYQEINEIFEKEFSSITFDACTVVGNCLMISRECINKTGHFDEIFEKGYTEETDYQFKAMQKGFEAKVLIDTYVFHESRVSFGEEEKQLKIRDEHLKIFFDRWKKEYDELMKKYITNNPIDYINNNLKLCHNNKIIKYKISNNVTLKEINFLNDLIIDGYNIDIIIQKNNDSWKKYNTLFIPRNANFFEKIKL